MSVITKFDCISTTISKLFEFLKDDDIVREDFEEYVKTLNAQSATSAQMQAIALNYVLERKLGEDRVGIIDLFIKANKKLDKMQLEVLKSLKNVISSVFEIKKILKNGFELYNLVNELSYSALSLTKMTNYRGVFAFQFAICRIFEFQGDYYLLEMSDVFSSSEEDRAMRYAVAKIIESPQTLYKDNKDKFKQIESQIKIFNKKFIKLFDSDEIITTNVNADKLIEIFNDFCEDEESVNKEQIKDLIKPLEEPKYFHVEEFSSSYGDFLEKSMEGFSAHSKTYDVGIIFDEQLGLFIIPFWATLKKVYETKDFTKIEGYKECLMNLLDNDNIPPCIINRLAAAYPNFMDVTNKILDSDYTLESLSTHYKPRYLEGKVFSSTSALYCSKSFAKIMGFLSEDKKPEFDEKIGRNEPCPCGSGKKYKKCCFK